MEQPMPKGLDSDQIKAEYDALCKRRQEVFDCMSQDKRTIDELDKRKDALLRLAGVYGFKWVE